MTICPTLTHPCGLTLQTHIHKTFFFNFFSTHHINHTDTVPTIHYSYAFHFITALVSLSLTFTFHAQAVELYNQCTFSKVNYSLKSSRLQIFIHKYFSWVRTIKIRKIGESKQNEQDEAHHINTKQPGCWIHAHFIYAAQVTTASVVLHPFSILCVIFVLQNNNHFEWTIRAIILYGSSFISALF